MTSFKKFQREIIDATLQGKDTLVIHPTGSGKSLCFQFPSVYAIVITPTISLMHDQVSKLNSIGISSVYLGSAQYDIDAEQKAFDTGSGVSLIFVTPEWISKASNKAKVDALASVNMLSLIAIDEAHLISEWSAFRPAFLS